MEKALLDQSILDATSQVWKLTLGFDLSPAASLNARMSTDKVFCVKINMIGSWRAQVVMQLPMELGEFAAWRIMGMNESESPSLHQISVVLKEVASAMADTIKLNMPGQGNDFQLLKNKLDRFIQNNLDDENTRMEAEEREALERWAMLQFGENSPWRGESTPFKTAMVSASRLSPSPDMIFSELLGPYLKPA